jgi:hypothetical protein
MIEKKVQTVYEFKCHTQSSEHYTIVFVDIHKEFYKLCVPRKNYSFTDLTLLLHNSFEMSILLMRRFLKIVEWTYHTCHKLSSVIKIQGADNGTTTHEYTQYYNKEMIESV